MLGNKQIGSRDDQLIDEHDRNSLHEVEQKTLYSNYSKSVDVQTSNLTTVYKKLKSFRSVKKSASSNYAKCSRLQPKVLSKSSQNFQIPPASRQNGKRVFATRLNKL